MPTDLWQHPKVARLLSLLQQVQPSGAGKKALCPDHHDVNPSLQIDIDGDDHKVLLYCHAGCSTRDILDVLGLGWPDLRLREMENGRVLIASYDYVAEDGALLYQKRRYDPKDFRIRKPDGRGGFTWFLGDMRRVLYRLDELQGQTACLVVEGEKDSDNLASVGLLATCNDGGASRDGARPKWKNFHTDQLKAAGIQVVTVIRDNDDAGRAHANAVVRSVLSAGLQAKIVTLDGLDEHGDVSDWLLAGHTAKELLALTASAEFLMLPEAETPVAGLPVMEMTPPPPPSDCAEVLQELSDVNDPWSFLETVRDRVVSDDQIRERLPFYERWIVLVAQKSASEQDTLVAVGEPVFKGVRRETMRSDIKKLQVENAPSDEPVFIEDTKPWDEAVDGAEVLDEAVAKIREFVTADPEVIDTLALYDLYTHVYDAFDIAPYQCLTSPTKRCGKTTAQEVQKGLVARPFKGTGFSGPVLFRTVDQFKPTLIIDEADSLFDLHEDMRMILNDGNRRGGCVPRCVGDDFRLHPFSVFGPKMLGLIVDGQNLPDTVADRSIIIPMRRRLHGEVVRRWRYKYIDTEMKPIGRKFAWWAQDNIEVLREGHDADTDFPVELQENARAEDIWEPLLKIADLVGGNWPRRARAAAIKLSGDEQRSHSEPVGVQLLADVRSLFRAKNTDKLASSAIVASLNSMHERPWATWKKQKDGLTQNNLADLLKEFKTGHGLPVQSKAVRIGTSTPRGYVREDFEDAWSRYLSPSATEAA